MANLAFRPIELIDRATVQEMIYSTSCRNCDLNFMNLVSWRSCFGTELAYYHGWLLFRFRVTGHLAYMPPIGDGSLEEILITMMADAQEQGEPLSLMGVCASSLQQLGDAMPVDFAVTTDRSYSDYLYKREVLAALTGKKLQSKRNHIHRFVHQYPDYDFHELTSADVEDCLALVRKWYDRKRVEAVPGYLTPNDELNSMQFVFQHWDELGGLGGVLRVGGRLIAFTYGAPINYDTFDVCVEKADIEYEGAFAMVNREFARLLPEKYIYVNREEDLGIEGLRKAKLSYHPDYLLDKSTLTVRAKL